MSIHSFKASLLTDLKLGQQKINSNPGFNSYVNTHTVMKVLMFGYSWFRGWCRQVRTFVTLELSRVNTDMETGQNDKKMMKTTK